jgi:hypothetical protein
MASTVPPVHNYVYMVIKLKISEESNGLDSSSLLCHYGETNYVFLIGGLVQEGATFMASSDIRHCRHILNFRFTHNNCLYLAKILNRSKDYEPIVFCFFF